MSFNFDSEYDYDKEDSVALEEEESVEETLPPVESGEVKIALIGGARLVDQGKTYLSGEDYLVSREEADRLLEKRTTLGRPIFIKKG